MKKLSLGCDSTLKNWRDLVAVTFGENSPATTFLDEKIEAEGEYSQVIEDEGQFLNLLSNMHFRDKKTLIQK